VTITLYSGTLVIHYLYCYKSQMDDDNKEVMAGDRTGLCDYHSAYLNFFGSGYQYDD